MSEFKKYTQYAFTLAEVMIVLAIIGIVAAIVLPSFMQDMAERINSHRQANIAQKITKSVELMVVNGDYQGIYNTEQFVDKLSKYLKIAKRCDSEHIADCWPTSKIKTSKGEEYSVENARTSKDLHIISGNTTDNVGLILADGATLIMTFNPNAAAPSAEGGFVPSKMELPVGGGKTEGFAYTSNATNAIDFVMDVNGATGPNQEAGEDNYYDIRSFKVASFSNNYVCSKDQKIDGMCIKDLKTKYSAINCKLSENAKYCSPNPNFSVDYWAGAKKACDDIGMELPDYGTLLSIWKNYSGHERVPAEGNYWTTRLLDNGDTRYSYCINMSNGSSNYYARNGFYANVLCIYK